MNIKSLLLGSAAALAVVSGAQAADAVVAAEPEPMEYVKVCDAYGTGYFYIPGTETCLKIGGQFRYEKSVSWTNDAADGADRTYGHWTRARIEITAKNDSEWGTVSSWIRMDHTYSSDYTHYNSSSATPGWFSSNGGAQDTRWLFGIGGLEMGYHDSKFASFFGYGGRTDDGGNYINWAYGARQQISYTASFDAITAVISLEQDAGRNSGLGADSVYMPDVVVGVSGAFGDYAVLAGFAYDESDDSFVITKKVTGNIDMFGFTLQGFYSNSDTNSYFSYDGFSIIAGLSAKVTDTVTLAKDFQYWDNGDWRIVGDVNWAVAPGFSVLLEASYADRGDVKSKGGFLRFERSF